MHVCDVTLPRGVPSRKTIIAIPNAHVFVLTELKLAHPVAGRTLELSLGKAAS